MHASFSGFEGSQYAACADTAGLTEATVPLHAQPAITDQDARLSTTMQ